MKKYNGLKLINIDEGRIRKGIRRLSNKLDIENAKNAIFIIEKNDGTFWATSTCVDDEWTEKILERVKRVYANPI